MPQVLFESDRVGVAPGETATLSLRVHNDSPVVQELHLEVLGAAATWGRLEPSTVNVFPGSTANVSLLLSPPPTTPLVGDVPVAVRATSAVDGATTVEEATIELAAVGAVQLELHPRTVRHRRRSKHHLEISNAGNAAASVRITAYEPDEVLDLVVHESRVDVEPGTIESVLIEATAVVSGSSRSGTRRPFTVRVEHEGTSITTDGALEQIGGRPAWLVPAALALAALLVAAVLLANRGGGTGELAAAERSSSTTSTTAAGASTPADGGAAGGPATPDGSGGGAPAAPSGPAAAATPGAPATTPGVTGAATGSPSPAIAPVAGVRPTTAPATAAPAPTPPPSMFVAMNNDGKVARGTAGTTITTVNAQVHDVTFPKDVNLCAVVASPGSTNATYIYAPTAMGAVIRSARVVRVTSTAPSDSDPAGPGKPIPFYLTAFCKDTTFAVVDGAGHLVRQQGASATALLGAGRTKVTFSRDISQCAYVASTDNASVAYVGTVAGDARSVLVETRSGAAGAGTSATGFQLAVACSGGAAGYLVRRAPGDGNYVPGTVVRSSPGVKYADQYGYTIDVTFPRSLATCSLNINLGSATTEAPPSQGFGSSDKGGDAATTRIEVKNGGGGIGGGTAYGFHLVSLCT